eukprot:2044885-Amphidinium_carterae.1
MLSLTLADDTQPILSYGWPCDTPAVLFIPERQRIQVVRCKSVWNWVPAPRSTSTLVVGEGAGSLPAA